MTHLRTGRQRGKKQLTIPMKLFRVGWRAYTVGVPGEATLISIGRDYFRCSTVEQAMRLATKHIPLMISEPGAQIGIRYVKEEK